MSENAPKNDRKSGGRAARRGPLRAGAVAAGALLALPAAGAAADTAGGTGFRFEVPEPTGGSAVGVAELHFVDESRDQWEADGPRAFMASVWYPADPDAATEPAGYMPQRVGELFAESQGITEEIDWEGSRVSAGLGAPADPDAGGLPVVLYSPGGGSPRGLGTTLAEDLASHGYVVVAMDHTGEAPVRFPDGRVDEPRMDTGDPELLTRLMTERVADARFVLDRLEDARDGRPAPEGAALPPGVADLLDLSEVGMFGHSMGGSAAAHTMHQDGRVDAGADLDGSIAFSVEGGGFEEAFPVADEGLDRPFLLVGGSRQAEEPGAGPVPNTHLTFEDWGRFWDNSTGWKRDVNFPEARHFSFTDAQALVPQFQEEFGLTDEEAARSIGTAEDPARLHATQRAFVAAFFDRHLKGEPRPILDGPTPDHPDVRFIE
ncbi:alpha/beta hydrolase family protein [Nocardiopsis potens]|uniref:alpha/beta hydrolase family protein n=1 Tax=Nocardiopsis potens TaxID=1246458 RepID=UPI00034ABE31|nr:hypothetical protein [Nocardiopsis potens]